jgi:hypothetical protein
MVTAQTTRPGEQRCERTAPRPAHDPPGASAIRNGAAVANTPAVPGSWFVGAAARSRRTRRWTRVERPRPAPVIRPSGGAAGVAAGWGVHRPRSLVGVQSSCSDGVRGHDGVVVGDPALWLAGLGAGAEQRVALRPVDLHRAVGEPHERACPSNVPCSLRADRVAVGDAEAPRRRARRRRRRRAGAGERVDLGVHHRVELLAPPGRAEELARGPSGVGRTSTSENIARPVGVGNSPPAHRWRPPYWTWSPVVRSVSIPAYISTSSPISVRSARLSTHAKRSVRSGRTRAPGRRRSATRCGPRRAGRAPAG